MKKPNLYSIINLYDIIAYSSLVALSIVGGTCLYNAEKDAERDIEKRYQNLPEAIKPYDSNRDGLIDSIEAGKLEQELLKHIEKEH